MPKVKEVAGMKGMRLPSLFTWEKGQEEYSFHHPLLRMVARGGGAAATS